MRTKLLFSFLLLTGGLFAQIPEAPIATEILATPNYLVTVILGVMLAIGFQFLLTSLSIAIGLTATPNLKETWAENKYSNNDSDNDKDWNDHEDSTNVGVVISSALGVWNVITAALSLFGATALALTLTHVVDVPIAVTLGLAIWAVFYMLMFYLEGRMVGTAIGSLINTAVSGLRAGGEAVKNLFTPTPASQVQSVADNTIEKLRKEMSATFDTNSINDTVDKFLTRIENDLPSYNKLKTDLKEIVKQGNSGGGGGSPATWTALQGVVNKTIDENDGGGDQSKKQKLQKLKSLVEDLRAEVNQPNTGGGYNGYQQIDTSNPQYIQQVTDWLQNATPESFDAEQLRTQFENFAKDPKGNANNLKSTITTNIKELDKDSVVDIISKNTNLEKDQVSQYADQAVAVLEKVKTSVGGGGNNGSGGSSDSKMADKLIAGIEGPIKNFIDSTDDPRLDYSSLKGDLVAAINNPNDAFDIVKARLNNYDRNTLVSVLTNNRKVDRSDINNIADQVEQAQHQVKDQIQKIEDEARRTAKQVERRAVIQAEHARKAAVAAAWWLFTAIVVSGVAAIAGSQIGAF